MSNRAFAALGVVLALPSAGAMDPPPVAAAPVTDRTISRRVDDLLRAGGTKLVLDQDQAIGNLHLKKETNRIHYHTSTKDQRLVRIEIEPVGAETPDSSKLAATFLAVLEAVDSVEDGMTLAQQLSAELAKDGRTRFISLGNGVKFIKEKMGDSPARYIIKL